MRALLGKHRGFAQRDRTPRDWDYSSLWRYTCRGCGQVGKPVHSRSRASANGDRHVCTNPSVTVALTRAKCTCPVCRGWA